MRRILLTAIVGVFFATTVFAEKISSEKLDISAIEACAKPTGIGASSTTTTATISWNVVAGAHEYRIRYKVSGGSSWTYVIDIPTNSKVLTGLLSGVEYVYQVGTECAADNSQNSGFGSSYTVYTKSDFTCTTPTGLSSSTTTSSTIKVNWNAVPGTGVQYTLRYKYYASPTWIYIKDISTNTYTLTGLVSGDRYVMQVGTECSVDNTVNSGFSGSYSAYTSASYTCSTPTGLTSSSVTSSTINATWTAISGTGVQYKLRYKLASAGGWTYVSDIATNAYTITGLAAGSKYLYQVGTECSVDNSVSSGFGDSYYVNTAPDYDCTIPLNLTSSSETSSSIVATWTAIVGTGVEYKIRYKVSTSSSWVYKADITTNSYEITGLQSGTKYAIQVATECSIDNEVSSGFGDSYLVYTESSYPCTTPTGLTAKNIGPDSLTFDWDENTGAKYRLRYRKESSPSWTQLTDIAVDSLAITGLETGVMYVWQVRTLCSQDGVVISDWSDLDSVITQYNVDCDSYLPLNLTVENEGFNYIDLTWDDANPFGIYNIGYRDSSVENSWSYLTGETGDAETISSLAQNKTYYFTIQLDCSSEYVDLVSSWSDSITGSTYNCVAPTSGFSVTDVTTSLATVSWNPVAGVDGYEVWYGVKGATIVDTLFTASPTLNLTSLFSGVNYRYEVRSVCDSSLALRSSFSTSPSGARHDFDTDGSPSCLPPTGFASTLISDVSIEFGWVDNGSNAFEVSYQASYETNNWQVLTTDTDDSHVFNSLSPGVEYKFRLRSVCTAGRELISSWTSIVRKVTSGTSSCSKPVGILFSSITENSAQVDWTTVDNANNYNIRYKGPGEDWTYITGLGTNTYDFASLTSNTNYNVQVKANCIGSVPTSEYSNYFQFKTSSPGRVGSDIALADRDIHIFPNPIIDAFKISIPNASVQSVEIYSLSGVLMKQLFMNSEQESIDISDLSQGVYLIQIQTDEGLVNKQIFKK